MLVQSSVVAQIGLQGGRQDLRAFTVLGTSRFGVSFDAARVVAGVCLLHVPAGSLVTLGFVLDSRVVFSGLRGGSSVSWVGRREGLVWQLVAIAFQTIPGFCISDGLLVLVELTNLASNFASTIP